MTVITTIEDIRAYIKTLEKDNASIGFVPTMGALHAGHAALVKRSITENDASIVSIFVNPTQFNNASDLRNYPRNLQKDIALLESLGCMAVFAPDVETFYSPKELSMPFDYDFAGLDVVMEGKFRPAHFNGVVQVVSKLFELIKPTRAYFGEKDFQQLAIIRQLVQRKCYPVEIVGCPIVREDSGLALSSRNALLSDEERRNAAHISQVLDESRQFVPLTPVEELIDAVTNAVNAGDNLKVEYFDIVDGNSLQSIASWGKSEYVMGCIAVYCGAIRLIDNIRYK
ncbi:MAG: pantoate--beta-alanine ligase [Prevotellaceae bacterium]|nr:pantoate--beta-alanine ligase [Prevotellaceae bacterium]